MTSLSLNRLKTSQYYKVLFLDCTEGRDQNKILMVDFIKIRFYPHIWTSASWDTHTHTLFVNVSNINLINLLLHL